MNGVRVATALRDVGGMLLFTAALAALAAEQPPVGRFSQDALRTVGPQAAHVLDLWRLMLALCGLVFAAVLFALLRALLRAPRAAPETPPDVASQHRPEARLQRRVTVAVVLSAVGLMVLIGASVATDRALAQLDLKDALHIRLTANQWWWQAHYADADPSRAFDTANELHVPVGRPVVLTLQSNDVIHSVWVPNVAGKKDLIPGRTAQLQLRVDRPGTYRGQCAEFCGYAHARMALVLVAEPPELYEAWAARQRQPAPPPADARLARGQQMFLSGTCVMCHTVAGTGASARLGPDLTHVGSRLTLAAGTLPNEPRALAEWITDPHRFKPGVNMPPHRYSPEDLGAMVAYLQSLR
jgi:cytochrome c oxidase subunit 2